MLGLAGLVVVTFLNNRLFPDLAPEARADLVALIRPELLTIGLVFLASAVLLLPVCWRAGRRAGAGAALYAAGAVPVSLPPLMPAALVEIGGLVLAAGLLVWGTGLIGPRPGPVAASS